MEFSASRIKDWLQTCDRDHEGCYDLPDNNPLVRGEITFQFREEVQSNFRLIDVELECVKDARLGDRYIALSYVCNLPSMFTLRNDNAELLYVEGYLERVRPDLPKTINDAIDLVQAIGERYLWVDSLCLINDNEGDIALGIRLMNSVFQGSYFNIIAASGTDANAGLWGLGLDTKELMVPQSFEVGIDLKTRLSKSEYSKRAWTLQELTLSQRALIFVDNRLFFRCQAASWDETSSTDKLPSLVECGTNEPRICGLPGPSDGALPSLAAYVELFEEYSRRELRYDGDAIRAFYGLLQTLFGGMETPSAEGLPAFYINAFMLFTSPGSNLRRRHEFASFSWAGWAGELKWPRENLICYDGDGRRTQGMSNIFRWLKRNEIAEWNLFQTPIDQGKLLQLGYPRGRLQGRNSHLLELLREFPHVFDSETVEVWRRHRDISTCSSFPIPSWDEEISRIENPPAASGTSKSCFSKWHMHAVNSQAEFNRLATKLDLGPLELGYTFRSWIAYHGCHLRKLRDMANLEYTKDIRFLGRDWPVALRPNTAISEYQKLLQGNDRRVTTWERTIEFILQDRNEPQDTPLPVPPKFPDYDVLLSWTICLRLTLAAPKPARNAPHPLLSVSGTVVGSLHPDNTSLLSPTSCEIELIVLSRCQTPIYGSALLGIEKERMPTPGQPWNLL
ncbi:hypothetical protein VE01_07934 [Pseudogymnoascus verrucosus]|uniref:Heterokaryon incompatibility domain-containing protein n=1 Tax=Pseudogymnoascus verrucosus TaxID=342668 RepID=A0A1B8GFI5_9PEZI|nr:uncharacterized protein VE01_07934 [Pseudogymnoascus verrucosus]OBT94587.2 hypothetical protein VE01_07934 [Pseudogymnoascus verrucosus]